jgi:hypothetical protein
MHVLELWKNRTSQQPAMAWTRLGKLWYFFHKGEAQNKSHHKAYCKGCVTVKLELKPADHPKEQCFTDGETYTDMN